MACSKLFSLVRRGVVFLALVCAVSVVLPNSNSFAVQPDEVLKDAELEGRARELSATLRCLVCQNQSIDDSDAPLARDLRLLVRERLVAGDSDSEVIDFLVARYGEFVLLKPMWGPHTLVLWLAPLMVFGVAVFFARRVLLSGVGPVGGTGKVAGQELGVDAAPLTEKDEARLKRILDGEDTDKPHG